MERCSTPASIALHPVQARERERGDRHRGCRRFSPRGSGGSSNLPIRQSGVRHLGHLGQCGVDHPTGRGRDCQETKTNQSAEHKAAAEQQLLVASIDRITLKAELCVVILVTETVGCILMITTTL